MTESYNRIKQLTEQFKSQEAAYLSPGYQESQVRQDFIDKFFTALGWDVTHEIQKNPYEQEVKIENKVNTSGSQRRADYAFFTAPNFRDVKFFVEAKKPSRNLANPNDYYQTIRYGWNSKTPIAVLTDFEEFHILDCRYKPDIKTALDRKIEVFRYTDYEDEEKFKRIFYLFNRYEVANGSIEKFAAALPKPRAKTVGMFKAVYKPVDEAFLESLDGYREQLARAFKNKNQNLEGDELTEAVQRTIDRLVFIRFLEDKSIEEPAIVAIKDKPAVWEAFASLCKRLEPKYNGLVFKTHRIIDSADFIPPESKMFAEICSELADPTSPYDFDKIPISILGSIYERFLGKVVSTTEKRAKVIEKPEVRKAGGVYYTPEYIVRYIVTETVGKLIKSKTPEEISKMSFADIACGSGSFLIEVYNQLLDYHTKYYNEHQEKAKKGDVETREGKIVLSLKKRQEILTNNIYGVDIDFQATEVTQLSLYLKLLEDVTMNDAFQYSLLKEKILPDLRNNIVCGNSLIGRDIFDGKLFDNETEHTLKPMNFEDTFPEIMRSGGFDAIVGNPPYIFTRELIKKYEKDYYNRIYKQTQFKINTYILFIEKGFGLLKSSGTIGFIIPNNWLTLETTSQFRHFILSEARTIHIVNSRDKVFENASVDTSILICGKNGETVVYIYELENGQFKYITKSDSIAYLNLHNHIIGYDLHKSNNNAELCPKISSKGIFLEMIAEVRNGIQAYTVGEGSPRQTKRMKEERVYHSYDKKDNTWEKYVDGVDVGRYILGWSKQFVKYGENLSRPRKEEFFRGERLLVRQIPGRPPYSILSCYVSEDLVNDNNSMIVIHPKNNYNIKYLLGILNSKLISFWFINTFGKLQRKVFPQFKIKELRIFPIYKINFLDDQDKSQHDQIVKLVEQMLNAKAMYVKANTEADKNRLEMQIASLDRQIDEAVYELYGLTEEEIRVVEGKK